MLNERIDQIEFRWTRYDFDAIAYSDREHGERLAQLVRGYAALSEGMGNELVPTQSAVYFCSDKGEAALILRSINPGARRIVQGGEQGRHALVSRVFTGDVHALSPRLAMCLATVPIPEFLGPIPGQVGKGETLPPVRVRDLQEHADAARHDLTNKGKEDCRLPALIAARLNRSDHPLSVILTPDELAHPPWSGGPAIPLLWGLTQTADRLLYGPETAPGWSATFSTYEPPLRDGEGRRMPRIIFQAGAPAGGNPAYGFHKVDLTGQGTADGFATGLAEAYRELGQELRRYLDEAWKAGSSLSSRMSHLRSEPSLLGYWSAPASQGAAAIAGSYGRVGTHGDIRASSESSALSATRDSDRDHDHDHDHDRTSQRVSAPPRREGATLPASAVPREDPYLLKMYGRLDAADGHFRTIVALLESKRRLGEVPAANDRMAILEQFWRSGWYVEQLLREYGTEAAATDVLARLLLPVVSGLLPKAPIFADPEAWSQVSPLVYEALAKTRHDLSGAAGEALEDLLVKLVKIDLGTGLVPVHSQPPPRPEPAPVQEQLRPGWVAGVPVGLLPSSAVAWIFWWALAATLLAVWGWS